MKTTAIITVALACLSSVQAETVDEAIADLNSQLASLKTSIDDAIQNGGKLIGETRASIGRVVNQADVSLQNLKDKLDNLVEQAEQKASDLGVDITNCVLQLNQEIAALDLDSVRICRNNQDLNLLRIKLGRLGQLKRQISGSVDRCLAQNSGSVEGLRSCVQADISSAQAQVVATQNEVNSVCRSALRDAERCVEGAVIEQNKIIISAEEHFKNCLAGVL